MSKIGLAQGSLLPICLPFFLALALGLSSLWNALSLEQRILRAEKSYLEKQRFLEHSFHAWQLQVKHAQAHYSLLKAWQGPCAATQTKQLWVQELSLNCGVQLLSQKTFLIYLDSVYGRQQRVLHFAMQHRQYFS